MRSSGVEFGPTASHREVARSRKSSDANNSVASRPSGAFAQDADGFFPSEINIVGPFDGGVAVGQRFLQTSRNAHRRPSGEARPIGECPRRPQKQREPEPLVCKRFPLTLQPSAPSRLPFRENDRPFRRSCAAKLRGHVVRRSRLLQHEDFAPDPARGGQQRLDCIGVEEK